MINKTMTDLNNAQPHLRDLRITIDGLNIVDIQMAGPGAWVPRMTVQLSGDMGLDKTTGQRNVYLTAAEFLRATLLNNGTGDGKRAHAFVPHANVSREDLNGDFDAAIAVAERAVARLLDVYKGKDPENDGKPILDDHFEWYGKSLYIKVETIDFNLTEKRVVDATSATASHQHLSVPNIIVAQSLIDAMGPRGHAGEINLDAASATADTSFIDELDVRNETKLFDGVEHRLVIIPIAEGAVDTNKLWVPVSYKGEITTFDDLSENAVLTCLSPKGTDPNEWRLLEKEVLLSVLNETKLFDGVPYKPKYLAAEGDVVTLWVKEGTEINVSCLEEIPADQRVLITAETDDVVAQWRLL